MPEQPEITSLETQISPTNKAEKVLQAARERFKHSKPKSVTKTAQLALTGLMLFSTACGVNAPPKPSGINRQNTDKVETRLVEAPKDELSKMATLFQQNISNTKNPEALKLVQTPTNTIREVQQIKGGKLYINGVESGSERRGSAMSIDRYDVIYQIRGNQANRYIEGQIVKLPNGSQIQDVMMRFYIDPNSRIINADDAGYKNYSQDQLKAMGDGLFTPNSTPWREIEKPGPGGVQKSGIYKVISQGERKTIYLLDPSGRAEIGDHSVSSIQGYYPNLRF